MIVSTPITPLHLPCHALEEPSVTLGRTLCRRGTARSRLPPLAEIGDAPRDALRDSLNGISGLKLDGASGPTADDHLSDGKIQELSAESVKSFCSDCIP